MTPERLEALREAHKQGMAIRGYHALADELFAEVERLTTERDRALRVIRLAYEAGDDAWRVCANNLHPTNPTRLAERSDQARLDNLRRERLAGNF